MEKKTLLTVNVVTYNHRPWIAKCLDSILEQQTNFKFIVRIFDDCSTDGTKEICAEYANKYPDIIQFYPTEKNLGLPANPLRSYRDITTPYYLYIEGDDWRKDVHGFQEQVDCLEHNTDIIFCAAQAAVCKNNIYYGETPKIDEGMYSKKIIIDNPKKLFFSKLLCRIVRTKYININKNYPQAYTYDVTQMYELLKKGNFYFIKKVFGVYNKTESGITTSLHLFDRIKFTYDRLYKYNVYTNREYEKCLFAFFYNTVGWIYNSNDMINLKNGNKIKQKEYKKSTLINYIKPLNKKDNHISQQQMKSLLKTIRRFMYLFFPPVIPMIFHGFRDMLRFLRKKVQSSQKHKHLIKDIRHFIYHFLPPLIPMAVHGCRDIIRSIRKRFAK